MRPIDPLFVEAIDALLPQTQCTQCGFAGCLPYAEAVAAGGADINRCPPGGDEGIRALSALTRLPYSPLDPVRGAHKPRLLAVIDEAACIGCTICIQKCPVDAILGAAKRMHTVIAEECTGCELCVAPCPVDCIALVPAPATHPALATPSLAASAARGRHRARLKRLARASSQRTACGAGAEPPPAAQPDADPSQSRATPPIGSPEHKRQTIAAAQARARALRDAAESR